MNKNQTHGTVKDIAGKAEKKLGDAKEVVKDAACKR